MRSLFAPGTVAGEVCQTGSFRGNRVNVPITVAVGLESDMAAIG